MMEHKRWAALVRPGEWFHLARFRFLPRRPAGLHTHDFPEVFWIESGAARHEINGRTESLRAGEVVFVRAPDRHRLAAADTEGFVLVNLAFDARVMEDLLQRHRRELGWLYPARAPLPVQRTLPPERMPVLLDRIGELARQPRTRLVIEHFLLGLFQLVQPVAAPAPAPLPGWLALACAEMQRPEHFAQGTRAFVRLAGRSPEHLARACRAHLGRTPTDYINELRMAHAARELRLGTKAILPLALECGLGNLSHFYALFRAAYGQTPRRYRLAHQHRIV